MTRHRRGIALVELLFVVVLFAAFCVIASELFVTMMRAQSDANRRASAYSRLDAALGQLRTDIWSASKISTPDPGTLNLTLAGGQSVEWTSDLSTLRRLQPLSAIPQQPGASVQSTQIWKDMPQCTFSAQGPLVTLTLHTLPAPKTDQRNQPPVPDEQITMTSQLMTVEK